MRACSGVSATGRLTRPSICLRFLTMLLSSVVNLADDFLDGGLADGVFLGGSLPHSPHLAAGMFVAVVADRGVQTVDGPLGIAAAVANDEFLVRRRRTPDLPSRIVDLHRPIFRGRSLASRKS